MAEATSLYGFLYAQPVISKRLDQITADDLQALIDLEVPESRTIEFKRALWEATDEGKAELRFDITSFANSGDGDIIVGIASEEGRARSLTPLSGDIDEEMQHVEKVLRSQIDPSLSSFDMRQVKLPQGSALVIRVRKSWRGPHFVIARNGAYRMYGRNSTGKFPFDAANIRDTILAGSETPRRIRRWRDEREVLISNAQTPVHITSANRLVLHIVPLSSFSAPGTVSPTAMRSQFLNLAPFGDSAVAGRYNIDGYVTWTSGSSRHTYDGYCQLFRDGRMEIVRVEIAPPHPSDDDRRSLASVWFGEGLARSVEQAMRAYKALDVSPPFHVFAKLYGMLKIPIATRVVGTSEHTFDRNEIELPEIIVESHDIDAHATVRPMLDALWNAAGMERCFNYDADGKWLH